MKLHFELTKSTDFIFEHLTNTEKFISLHPVITKIDQLEGNKYLIYETLKVGSIPVSFTYPATIDSNKKDLSIVMVATIMKLTKIEINYKITNASPFTLVDEQINFRTLFPINLILRKIFKKQHIQFFKNMEDLIE